MFLITFKVLHRTRFGTKLARPDSHNKNIATSVSIEAAELLEHFQWEDLSYLEIMKDQEKMESISQEIADIIIYLFRLIHNLDLDFKSIIKKKIELNRSKYPINFK